MTDILEDVKAFEAVAELLPAEQKLTKVERRPMSPIDRVNAIQDKIYAQAHAILEGVQSFADVKPEDTAPPPAWIAQLGEEAAWKKFRLAQYGIMSAKEAPVGIKVAEHIATSIARTKAMERAPVANLNVAVIHVHGEKKQYPKIEVEE